VNSVLARSGHHRRAVRPQHKFRCKNCGCALTLHQPDQELAERLLGTCEKCKCWYVTNSQGTVLAPIVWRGPRLRFHRPQATRALSAPVVVRPSILLRSLARQKPQRAH
jgi:hypothetical protein